MHLLTRRSLVVAAAALPLAGRAQEQPWPSAPIKIVVPYPPGGSTDVIARLVQPELQQRLGATVIIENRPGASGSIGTAAVVKAPADGNSWLMVFDNPAANPFVLPTLPYDTVNDLDPVLLIGTAPYVISTQAAKPFHSLSDVIAAAKGTLGGREELRSFLAEQMRVWGAVAREHGIRAERKGKPVAARLQNVG